MELSRLQRFLNWYVGIATIVWIGGHGMRIWSHIHRYFHCAKYGSAPLPKMDVATASIKMQGFQWRRDGLRSLGDAVCTPQKVLAIGFLPGIEEDNDCDEEAIFLTNSLEDPWVLKAEMMTIMWWDPEDGFSGHNVCLITRASGVQFMDYGSPNAMCQTERQVAEMVVSHYTGGNGVLTSWYVSDKNLVPLRGGRV